MATSVSEEVKCLSAAVLVIDSFYEWLDRIEELGGATTIEGISACHSFLESMRRNEPRLKKLVIDPSVTLIKKSMGK